MIRGRKEANKEEWESNWEMKRRAGDADGVEEGKV